MLAGLHRQGFMRDRDSCISVSMQPGPCQLVAKELYALSRQQRIIIAGQLLCMGLLQPWVPCSFGQASPPIPQKCVRQKGSNG